MKEKIELDDKYNAQVEGQYTFYGVLSLYYETLFRRCNEDTRSNYNRDYNRWILPDLADRVMKDLEMEDYERVMQKVQDKGYATATVQHYRYLIRTVVQKAAKEKICEDVLFGSVFSLPPEEAGETTRQKEFVRNRKSLKIEEEVCLFRELMTDPQQEGARMGLALMFGLGLRNNEACGMVFGAIRPMETHPECYCAWVYQTTEGETGDLKAGGKTKNAPRILPIPPKLLELLQGRRAYLERLIAEGTITLRPEDGLASVDDLPIACQKSDYTAHCSSRHLTAAGRILLRAIQVNEDEVAYIDRELQNPEQRTKMDVTEKDPTAYLLRRNLGTHLYILGLTEAEIQYFMGHAIDDPYALRNDFTNEERLYPIFQKLSNRPLFNDEYPYQRRLVLSEETPFGEVENVPSATIQIVPRDDLTLSFQVSAAEPGDPVVVSISKPSHADSERAEGTYRVLPSAEKEPIRTVNVLAKYQEAYRQQPKREE